MNKTNSFVMFKPDEGSIIFSCHVFSVFSCVNFNL